MSYYPPVLGTYTFRPGLVLKKIPRNRNVPTVKLPREDGDAQATGYLTGRKFEVEGKLSGGSLPTVTGMTTDQLLDELVAALDQAPCNFQWRPDRYVRLCQVSDFVEAYDEGNAYGRNVAVSFAIVAGDPFVYAVTTTQVTQAISGATTNLSVTPGGNVYCRPQISLTVGTGGQLSATITNNTTGDICTLNGVVTGGQVIVLDSLLKQVTINNSDFTSLWDGTWIRLFTGVNALTVSYSVSIPNSATFSSITIYCQDRFSR